MAPATTFHEGELALQRRSGAFARLAEVGPRVIRAHMPDAHREFFAELPFLLAGSVDAQGQPWASLLAGPPGFAYSPDPRSLRIQALPAAHDPMTLQSGLPIGLLGIQPHTRRRNRINGWVRQLDGEGFTVGVAQSFGNCPKYIQPREALYAGPAREAGAVRRMRMLDADARALIARADTFFIATAHPLAKAGAEAVQGVDVSHRGGPSGFVRIEGADRLTVPDFIGNSFFNTLGNLQLNPRCGLLFISFEHGHLLYLAARASLEWEGPAVQAVEGAQRLLRFELEQAIHVPHALPLRWA